MSLRGVEGGVDRREVEVATQIEAYNAVRCSRLQNCFFKIQSTFTNVVLLLWHPTPGQTLVELYRSAKPKEPGEKDDKIGIMQEICRWEMTYGCQTKESICCRMRGRWAVGLGGQEWRNVCDGGGGVVCSTFNDSNRLESTFDAALVTKFPREVVSFPSPPLSPLCFRHHVGLLTLLSTCSLHSTTQNLSHSTIYICLLLKVNKAYVIYWSFLLLQMFTFADLYPYIYL